MIGLKVRTHSGSVADISDLFRLRGLQEFSLKPHKFPKWLKWMLFGCIAAIPILYEMRTSAVQSWILSSYARKMSYKMGPGSSPNIVFPKHGPFDIRAGYALIPDFEKRLGAAGFRTTEQARFSRELERAAR